ncbi:MAG: amidohydrolase family protein [Deltaproteobacteria bacterium]|nr:amidohydrolase family protein [Deltaproteobacteria bacterium]
MKPFQSLIILALAMSGAVHAAHAATEAVAIENATVHVERGKKLERATVLIKDGVIAAVGNSVQVPAGTRRIDGTGKVVTAGLVDSFTVLGLVEVGLVKSTNEGAFPGGESAVHAAYRVTDGYNPASIAIPVARAGGVTQVITVPRGGLVSGMSAWVTLGHDRTLKEVTVLDPVAMHVALGEEALASASGSRGKALERLRELLDDAAQYSRRRDAFERNQMRRLAASRLDLEALAQVVQGKLPLVVRVDRAADIMAAVKLATELNVRVIIAGGTEAWMVATHLARAKVPVILNPMENLPSSFDRVHVRDDAAAILVQAGVAVALSTMEEAMMVRTLRQAAGNAVAQGLSWDDALAAVTSVPAALFGLKGRGVLKEGAAADLVLWSGDPFELSTRAEKAWIGGAPQPMGNRQDLLREQYRGGTKAE